MKKYTSRTAKRRFSTSALLGPAALLLSCSEPGALPGDPQAPAAPPAQAQPRAPLSTFVAHTTTKGGAATFTWLGGALSLPAGAGPAEAARATLGHLGRAQGLPAATLATAALRAVHDTGSGAVIAQFQQRVEDIEVFRAGMSIAMDRQLRPVAATGTLAKALRPRSKDFGTDGRAAVQSALRAMSGAEVPSGQIADAGAGEGGYQRYALPSATARTRKVWFPQPGGLQPARYVEIDLAAEGSTDSRLEAFVVSARGEVLFRHDMVVGDSYSYRVWADKDGTYTPWDNPQGNDYTPHPTGMKDGKTPPMKDPNLVALASAPFSKMDPWLGPGATQLKGNNVFAYADLSAPDGYNAGDVMVTPTAPGVFDRVYDPNTKPQGSTESIQAITTHLFYVINYMHDSFYDAGWDEKSLNPQQDNYGRGGTAGDPTKAEAQDYSGRNNANASTPADGASPRIQMYLFDTSLGRKLSITLPADIAGDYPVAAAAFGPQDFDALQTFVIAKDGTAPAEDGCEAPFVNATDVSGKVALIDRGTCNFTQKVLNAQAAGARGVLIVNNAAGLPPNPMGGTPASPITIPTLGISQADGNKIKAKLMAAAVRGTLVSHPIDRDGALDTTIVSHEWGHTMSNRLVGNGSGLSSLQGRGMGEGWSDFAALLTITRPEDAMVPANAGWAGVFPVGAYAIGSGDSYYEGIRRYPYSTDKSKNPLTFKHIQKGVALPDLPVPAFGADGADNEEVHNTGEVWAAMLWECYTSLIKDGRYTFPQASQKMREYLVAHFKLMPMAPTILEARDAMLAAAYAGEPKDYALFWQAFARRGAGTGASGPARSAIDNKPVVESFLVGNDLQFLGATLDDSAKSCDHDGVLDAGEAGVVKITIRNTGGGSLTATTAKLAADHPAVTFPDGATVTFPKIDPYQTGFATVKIALNEKDVPAQVKFNLSIDLDDPMLTTPGTIKLSQAFVANYDDKAESSGTDNVDAKNTLWSTAGDAMLDGSIKWERAFTGGDGRWVIVGNESPSDQYLISPPLQVGDMAFGISFKHRYKFETAMGENADGGVLEISSDAGMTWTDLGDKMTANGYGGSIYKDNQALSLRKAFVSTSTGYPMSYVTTTLDLGTDYKGKTVLVRFRLGTDEGTSSAGWEVDDLVFTGLSKLPFPSRVANQAMCTNHPPVANAGQDQTVLPGAQVTLMGSGTDPDGDKLTFRWTQSGGAMVALGDAKAAQTGFTAPATPDGPVELTFTLVANDGKLDSQPAPVKITVDPGMVVPRPTDDMDDMGCKCNVSGKGGRGADLGLLLGLGLLWRSGRRRKK